MFFYKALRLIRFIRAPFFPLTVALKLFSAEVFETVISVFTKAAGTKAP